MCSLHLRYCLYWLCVTFSIHLMKTNHNFLLIFSAHYATLLYTNPPRAQTHTQIYILILLCQKSRILKCSQIHIRFTYYVSVFVRVWGIKPKNQIYFIINETISAYGYTHLICDSIMNLASFQPITILRAPINRPA